MHPDEVRVAVNKAGEHDFSGSVVLFDAYGRFDVAADGSDASIDDQNRAVFDYAEVAHGSAAPGACGSTQCDQLPGVSYENRMTAHAIGARSPACAANSLASG